MGNTTSDKTNIRVYIYISNVWNRQYMGSLWVVQNSACNGYSEFLTVKYGIWYLMSIYIYMYLVPNVW